MWDPISSGMKEAANELESLCRFKLLHPVFDNFVKLSETLEAEPSILLLVEELCASARYYYAGEKHNQPALEKLLQRFLNTTGAGTLQGLSVGASNSITDTVLAVSLQCTERVCTC